MTARQWMVRTMASGLARRGFEMRRHHAARRQAMLSKYNVDLVLDVGASGGGYGSSLRAFGYTGRIISFEPLSAAYSQLQATIATDPNWTAQNVALGAEAGESVIHVASNSTSSSLLGMLDAHIEAAPSIRYVGQETISVTRLDDAIAESLESARSPFLKIDAQGFEREVLSGAPHTVAACVGLQLELSFVPLYEGGMLVDEALSWAYGLGFELVSMEQGYSAPTGEILQMDGVFVRSRGAAAAASGA